MRTLALATLFMCFAAAAFAGDKHKSGDKHYSQSIRFALGAGIQSNPCTGFEQSCDKHYSHDCESRDTDDMHGFLGGRLAAPVAKHFSVEYQLARPLIDDRDFEHQLALWYTF